jgi:hypothetical protein
MSLFSDHQTQLDYFNSEEFKQAEKERIERSLVEEHVDRGKGRVWCPIEGKVRPEWLCAYEHGDRDSSIDNIDEDNFREEG